MLHLLCSYNHVSWTPDAAGLQHASLHGFESVTLRHAKLCELLEITILGVNGQALSRPATSTRKPNHPLLSWHLHRSKNKHASMSFNLMGMYRTESISCAHDCVLDTFSWSGTTDSRPLVGVEKQWLDRCDCECSCFVCYFALFLFGFSLF